MVPKDAPTLITGHRRNPFSSLTRDKRQNSDGAMRYPHDGALRRRASIPRALPASSWLGSAPHEPAHSTNDILPVCSDREGLHIFR